MLANGVIVALALRWIYVIVLITLFVVCSLLSSFYWLQTMPTEFFIYDMMIYHDKCSVSYQVRDGDSKRFDVCSQIITNPTTGELIWSLK